MPGVAVFTVLSLLCLLSFAAVAHADVPTGLPCDERELSEALSARSPDLALADVGLALSDGRVLVTVGERVRVVDLGAADHADAARVLALVITDLAREEKVPVTRAPTLPPSTRVPAATSAALPADFDRARLGLDAAAQRGLVAEEPWSFDLGLSASARLWRRFVLGMRVGYMSVPKTRSLSTDTSLRFDALTLRPAIGLRFKLVELAVGPSVVQYWVQGGVGHHDTLPGASAQLTLWLPVVRSLRIAARLCFDVLGNRSRLYAGADRVLTTPRTMLGLALGFAWGWS